MAMLLSVRNRWQFYSYHRSTKMVLTKSTRPARRSPRFSPTKGGAGEDPTAGVPAIEKVSKKASTKHTVPSGSSPRFCPKPDGAQNDDPTIGACIPVKVTKKEPTRRSPRVSRNTNVGASTTAFCIPELAPRAHIKKQSTVKVYFCATRGESSSDSDFVKCKKPRATKLVPAKSTIPAMKYPNKDMAKGADSRVAATRIARKMDGTSEDVAACIPEVVARSRPMKGGTAIDGLRKSNAVFGRLRAMLNINADNVADPKVADPKAVDPKVSYHKAVDEPIADAPSSTMPAGDAGVLSDAGVITAPGSRPEKIVPPVVGSASKPVVIVSPAFGSAAKLVEIVSPAVGSAAKPVEIVSPVVGSAAKPVDIVSPVVGSASRPVEIGSPADPAARPAPLNIGGATVMAHAGVTRGDLIDKLSPTGQEAAEGLIGLQTGMFPASLLFANPNAGLKYTTPVKTYTRTKAATQSGIGGPSVSASRQSACVDKKEVGDALAGPSDGLGGNKVDVHKSTRHRMAFTPPGFDLGFGEDAEPVAKQQKHVSFVLPDEQLGADIDINKGAFVDLGTVVVSQEEIELFDIYDREYRKANVAVMSGSAGPSSLETPMKNISIAEGVECSATPASTIVPKRVVHPSKYVRGRM
ncbi:uncharacterized protein LOC100822775 isoform X3 [Brachypodium distachyon]|uniref:uncharacterized protein LOC100822775 isoform X3 n=1 Tax=Brachypodium distachyon TaxID=15368 RepID=UPI000D0D2126|nr:uncharacterized protein LOC100822775 isoform X3 [Brachypodium distachyon]XP_024310917.1 uncharacterized protein LOC100822775 isoform X3 [Brachypodium distachyon]|eukprot:XP_024310916.1 uncharacterized protein LOC100822775 isoform X3 [Brachypodium distachyon]